jgi:hypothetical protein
MLPCIYFYEKIFFENIYEKYIYLIMLSSKLENKSKKYNTAEPRKNGIKLGVPRK